MIKPTSEVVNSQMAIVCYYQSLCLVQSLDTCTAKKNPRIWNTPFNWYESVFKRTRCSNFPEGNLPLLLFTGFCDKLLKPVRNPSVMLVFLLFLLLSFPQFH